MRFSAKQRRVLAWWKRGGADNAYDAVICDGAVRSGKTLCIGLSFFCWAMCSFSGKNFAVCGKTAAAAKRNVWDEVRPMLVALGMTCSEKTSQNKIILSIAGRQNTFFLFGGKDEAAAGHIQGMTLAGILLDEVALMPRSFVEQGLARCSAPGSRFWFSCNPEGPGHWFYQEWICKRREKNALYLTFAMRDNPGLSRKVRQRYESLFEGVFYRRFVLGEWVAAQGLVYDFFDESYLAPMQQGEMESWFISCDYGTINPTSMGLWGRQGGVWYRVGEYYYDSRRERRQKTDQEYAQALAELAGQRKLAGVVVDPSAASFIETLRREGLSVVKAENDVLSGIRVTARLLKERRLVICQPCRDAIREFSLYRWEERELGQDRVRKEHDHAMDDIRYFAATIAARAGRGGFFAGSVERKGG